MNSSIEKNCTAFILILLIIGFVYSNTLDADWHLDDYHNILKNPWIHIDDFYPETVKQTFFAAFDKGEYTGENIYRPIVMFSFAVNWYFGKKDVFGYHLINIGIHMLSALFLFLCIKTLLTTPNIREKYRGDRYSIALLATVLWAVHPIQIQGVTYIVQRMASMAGMFYIAAFYTYLKARLVPEYFKKVPLLGVSLLLFVLAVFSKQNAVLLPLVLLAMEFVFFRSLSRTEIKKLAGLGIVFILLFSAAAGVLLYFDSHRIAFIDQYSSRPFSLSERLMTEARVMFLYLYQLFYPVSSNYSIAHDIPLSTSLIRPWTTLPSILFIFGSVSAAIFTAYRLPLLSFAVLFFFINHLVESTFIPLEIVFEHRNYIPSMFLFVPVAAAIWTVLEKYREQPDKRPLFYIYALIAAGLIMIVGIGTYTRNMDWRTEKGFWEDAQEKAPGLARPLQNLAVSYYLKIRDYDTAAELLERAIDLKDSNPGSAKMVSYHNLSRIFVKKNEMEAACLNAEKAVNAYPEDMAVVNYIDILIRANRLDTALLSAERYIQKKPDEMKGYEFKTIVLIKQDQFQKAEESALKLIKREPFNIKYITYFGLVHSGLGHYAKADFYLKKAFGGKSPDRLSIYLALIGNSIRAGDEEKTAVYTERLFERFTIHAIDKKLKSIQDETYPLFSLPVQKIEKQCKAYLMNYKEVVRG